MSQCRAANRPGCQASVSVCVPRCIIMELIWNSHHMDENQYIRTYHFILVQTSSTLPMEKRICTGMKFSPNVHPGTYWYVPRYTFDQSISWYIPVCTNTVYISTTRYILVYSSMRHTMVYRLVYIRMRMFQVKFIVVHKSTSPVDLVYTLLGSAGLRESRRIAAT